MLRRRVSCLFLLLLACGMVVSGQGVSLAAQPDGAESAESEESGSAASIEPTQSPRFDWREATRQSILFLTVQHGLRLTQRKTRNEFRGPFFADWGSSVGGIRGWGDGDSVFTNYVGHPMQGGVSGFIQIQNDPRGRHLEFSNTRPYWNSRLRAFGWAALYSTQFEIGPYSEATIGNVGKKKGTAGLVDLVVTPAGGLGMIVAEDWLDKHLVQKLESRTASRGTKRFYRMLFNPQRSLANLLRGKTPWYRDTRGLQ